MGTMETRHSPHMHFGMWEETHVDGEDVHTPQRVSLAGMILFLSSTLEQDGAEENDVIQGPAVYTTVKFCVL